MMENMQAIIKENLVYNCLDCGKCSAVCPITRWETRQFTTPRLLVGMAIEGQIDEMREDSLFWSCLTCMRCSQLCPSNVSFSEFLRAARNLAQKEDHSGGCTHSGMIQTWGRMMTNPDLRQDRLGWLGDDLRTSEDSDTIYFSGCLPYYDSIFSKQGFEGIKIAQSAVKILNHLGIEPNVLADERCCGHDHLWEGDIETFRLLAELNLERLKASGAKRIVTTCPECARTLKLDYPEYVGNHNLEVLHIAELFAKSDLSSVLPEQGTDESQTKPGQVTYQDPCRLGRHLGVYDAPREVISALGYQLAEMEHARKTSLCCGTSCWTECGQVNKNIQVERLREAKATGAELLVTACFKCQIHFKCAQNDPFLEQEIDIKIHDLTTLVADSL